MAAVYYSPLQFYFWYDNPFVDHGEAELAFWKACPTVFDESIALDGAPGDYIIQARRKGNDWFVGCLNNDQARTVTIPTDFLGEGAYQVQLFTDDPSLDTRTQVKQETRVVRRGTTVVVRLQPRGGAALIFRQ
jgi:alpha-glucosidase